MGTLEAKIHQGRFDSEEQLLNLRKNAEKLNNAEILDAANQRLKKVHPKIYQRLVGPLHVRSRDQKYKCYCNNPKSLNDICKEIVSGNVHPHCLSCDDCWQDDLCSAWGYYGWTMKLIEISTWNSLCEERANYKFVE